LNAFSLFSAHTSSGVDFEREGANVIEARAVKGCDKAPPLPPTPPPAFVTAMAYCLEFMMYIAEESIQWK
jgi:hypothetical protein